MTADPTAPDSHRAAVAAALADRRLRLDAVVGRGASCIVHRAHRGTGPAVAVKVARPGGPEPRALIRREAQVLTHLGATRPPDGPPGVVRLLEVVHTDLVDALVLTPCGDTSLAQHLTRADPWPPFRRLALATEVVAAVTELHRAGVVHGDLAPTNIVLADGRPVVIDLAAACVDGWCDPMIRGTLPFVAPELLRGEPPTERADVFAVGRIVMDVLAGPGVSGRPEPDPALRAAGWPVALRRVLRATTSPDARRRPRDLAALADALAGATERIAVGPVTEPIELAEVAEIGAAPVAASAGVHALGRTRVFGPRPPRPDPPAGPSRWRRARPAAAAAGIAVAALATAGAVGAVALGTAPGPTDPAPSARGTAAGPITAAPPAAGTTPSPTACDGTRAADPTADPAAAPPTGVGPGAVLVGRAALDATGCAEVWWDAGSTTATAVGPAGTRRFTMGRPGDRLLIGHWTCDDRALPALVRPGTGEVFRFDAWAGPGIDPTAAVEHLAAGAAFEVVDRDGCDHVQAVAG